MGKRGEGGREEQGNLLQWLKGGQTPMILLTVNSQSPQCIYAADEDFHDLHSSNTLNVNYTFRNYTESCAGMRTMVTWYVFSTNYRGNGRMGSKATVTAQ